MMIENANGTFTYVDTRDHRVEPTAEERQAANKADKIDRNALLKEHGWSDGDLEHAQAFFGFPKALGFRFAGVVWVTRTAVYSRSEVAEWRERFLKFSARVR
jgi:hypothetical protein